MLGLHDGLHYIRTQHLYLLLPNTTDFTKIRIRYSIGYAISQTKNPLIFVCVIITIYRNLNNKCLTIQTTSIFYYNNFATFVFMCGIIIHRSP